MRDAQASSSSARLGRQLTVSVACAALLGCTEVVTRRVASGPVPGMVIDLTDMPGDYVFPAGEPVDFNVRVDNPLPEGILAHVGVRVSPFAREPIHDDEHGPIWINPHPDHTKAVGVLLGDLPAGHYDVHVTIRSDDVVVAERDRAFAVVQAVEHLDPENSPFGLCGGALFHLELSDHSEEGETRLRQHEATGVAWGRNDLWWGQIEVEPGVWDWRKCDSVVDRFREHGTNLLAILCYSTDWLDGEAPTTPEARAEYVEYTRRMVRRYGDRISHWEIWNEPNITPYWVPTPDAEAYAALLREAHGAIKEEDPDAQIVGLCTSGVPLEFIETVLDAGGGEWMDVLSVHPYQGEPPWDWSPDTSQGRLLELRARLDERGLEDLPIWVTEGGWPTQWWLDHVTQAEYLVKHFVGMFASGVVERIHWFNLTDWGEPGEDTHGHFGLVEVDHAPKPSYAAFNNLIARLHDYDSVQDLRDQMADVETVVFHRPVGDDHGEEVIAVAWSEGEPTRVPVPGGARVWDVVGLPLEAEEQANGARIIPVGGSPVYIVTEVEQ